MRFILKRLSLTDEMYLRFYKKLVQNLFYFMGPEPENGAYPDRFRIIAPKIMIPIVFHGTGILAPLRANFFEAIFIKNEKDPRKSSVQLIQHYENSRPLNYMEDSFIMFAEPELIITLKKSAALTSRWIFPFLINCWDAQRIIKDYKVGIIQNYGLQKTVYALEHCIPGVCPFDLCQETGKTLFH